MTSSRSRIAAGGGSTWQRDLIPLVLRKEQSRWGLSLKKAMLMSGTLRFQTADLHSAVGGRLVSEAHQLPQNVSLIHILNFCGNRVIK